MGRPKFEQYREDLLAHQSDVKESPFTPERYRARLLQIATKCILDKQLEIGSWDDLLRIFDDPLSNPGTLQSFSQNKKDITKPTVHKTQAKKKNVADQELIVGRIRDQYYLIRTGLKLLSPKDNKFDRGIISSRKNLVPLLRQAQLIGRLYRILERVSDRQRTERSCRQGLGKIYAMLDIPSRSMSDYTKRSEILIKRFMRLRTILNLPTRDRQLLGIAKPKKFPDLGVFLDLLHRRRSTHPTEIASFNQTIALAIRLAFIDENPIEPLRLSPAYRDAYALRHYCARISGPHFRTL